MYPEKKHIQRNLEKTLFERYQNDLTYPDPTVNIPAPEVGSVVLGDRVAATSGVDHFRGQVDELVVLHLQIN